jgi:hypothetical protein
MSKTSCSRRNLIRMSTLASLGGALLLAISASALAGGFQLSVETPSSSSDAQMKDVVLLARTYGCHQPADAKLLATAEGLVNGARKTVALELRSIESGVYAIKQQWPSEGTWVLALTGAYNGMTSSVLIELGPNGKVLPGTRLQEGALKGTHARGARRQWIASDIDAALRTSAGLTSETSGDADRPALSPLAAITGPITWLLAGLGASAISIGFVTRSRRRHASNEISG